MSGVTPINLVHLAQEHLYSITENSIYALQYLDHNENWAFILSPYCDDEILYGIHGLPYLSTLDQIQRLVPLQSDISQYIRVVKISRYLTSKNQLPSIAVHSIERVYECRTHE